LDLKGRKTDRGENCVMMKLHSLYFSPNIVRVIQSRMVRWAGHVARTGEVRCVYRVLARWSEGKRPLERPRRRWEDNIKLDLRNRWVELHSAASEWGPVAGFCEHSNEPSGPIKKAGYFLTI
jgi:hypothetical protein